MNYLTDMDRIEAIKMLGKQMEEDIWKKTTSSNYAYIVRKVYKGSTLSKAINSQIEFASILRVFPILSLKTDRKKDPLFGLVSQVKNFPP